MSDHKSVEVDRIPNCDLCATAVVPKQTPAIVDGKTRMGPWANMCERHFKQYGCGLGLGRGQQLILRKDGK